MGESSVRIGIYANDKASAQIKSVEGGLRGIATQAKTSILTGIGLGAGITAFNLLGNAIGAVTGFLKDSVQAAIDDEASVRRLTAALEANIPGWDGNTDAIERTIKASQRLGFTDDETRASLTFLTATTNDLTKAQELHNTAMDLARFKGISLQAASEALVKVESGRFRLLAGLGIQLRAGATATEALAAVQAVAAGQAEEFGDTTAGAMLGAQVAMEEAGEELARSFLPAIKEAAEFVRDDLAPAIGSLGSAADAVNEDLKPISDVLNAISDAGVALHHVLTGTTETFEGAGEQAIATSRDWLRAHEQMGGASEEAFAGIEEDADALVEDMRDLPGDIADALREGRQDWQDALEQLSEDMEAETSRAARIAGLQGALAGSNLAAGLRSSDPLVRNQAIATRTLIQQQLAIEGVFVKGYNIGALWSKGLVGGVLSQLERLQVSLWYYKQLMIGKSPPPKGPLKDIDTGGFNIGKSWAENMTKGIGTFAMPSLGIPGVAGAMAPATAGAASGGTIHTHVYLDGREIAEAVSRHNYFAAPGGPSRLPR